jgi:hypothetical protein
MRKILILLMLVGATGAGADDTVSVYQLSGGVQCADESGIPAEKAADLLRAQGVKVLSTGRSKLPVELPARCGAPTGEANVITVAAADWSAFVAQNPDGGGYGLWIFEIPIDEMANELKGSGIEVLKMRKANDGLGHIGVCGASTGSINAFEIRRDLLPAAQKLGYRMLVTHGMVREIKPHMQRTATTAPPKPSSTPPATESAPLLW